MLVFFLTSNLFAQLKELEVNSEKAPSDIPPVFMDYPKKAAIIIYSDLYLEFESNLGIISKKAERQKKSIFLL